MSSYSTQTVTQLKDILKARGLPINGVKADLISRLEESDKIDAELDAEEEAPTPDVAAPEAPIETAPATEAATVIPPDAPTAVEEKPTEPVTETQASEPAPAPKEERKALSPDELKEAAVDLISKKIARAEKFGNEDELPALKASLKRIEKFGISLESSLAKELGFAAPEKPQGAQKARRFSNNNNNSSRVFKNKNKHRNKNSKNNR